MGVDYTSDVSYISLRSAFLESNTGFVWGLSRCSLHVRLAPVSLIVVVCAQCENAQPA